MARKKSSYTPKLKRSIADGRRVSRLIWRFVSGFGIGLLGFSLVVWLLYSWCCSSPFFQIESIIVTGSKRFSDAEIVSIAGLDIRSNLMSVSSKEISEKLVATGWIAAVDINKGWPSSMTIRVKERQAVAMVKTGSRPLLYLDRYGKGFARVGENDDLDFPVVSLEDEDVLGDRKAMKGVLDMMRYASRGNVGLPKQNISQLILAENGDITLYLADNPCPIFLGQGKMWKKYKQLARVLSWLYKKKKFVAVSGIDMEYLERRVLVTFRS